MATPEETLRLLTKHAEYVARRQREARRTAERTYAGIILAMNVLTTVPIGLTASRVDASWLSVWLWSAFAICCLGSLANLARIYRGE